ncbi:MAG: Acetyltransferase, family [Myxococcaceae bacterium]|nr:Acetyltransferase, family [Myxococcaceae bacterium]
MTTFKVRPARRGDATPITALMTELGFTADAATVTWIVSHPEMELLVAADALDKAIGIVCLAHRPQIRLGGRVASIEELMVTQAWRRKGVGRELLKRAVERARVLGVKKLEVQSLTAIAPEALAFFSACGFLPADTAVFRLA